MTELEKEIIKLQDMILALSKRLDEVLNNRADSDRPWTKAEAAQWLSVHPGTLADYLQDWQEGIHYYRLPGKTGAYRYNPELIKDWLENRNDPIAHQQAIAVWNSRRLCNQKPRKRTK